MERKPSRRLEPKLPYTPEQWASLKPKTTAEERLLWSIFGDYPPAEELQTRPDDYPKIQREIREEERRQKMIKVLGLPAESTLEEVRSVETSLLKDQVERVLDSLNDRERFVLQQRFGLEDGRQRTLVDVGKIISRSERTVRRIENSALKKLRQPQFSRRFRDILE